MLCVILYKNDTGPDEAASFHQRPCRSHQATTQASA